MVYRRHEQITVHPPRDGPSGHEGAARTTEPPCEAAVIAPDATTIVPQAPVAAPPARRPRRKRQRAAFPYALLVLLVLLGAWETASRTGLIQAILLPPPTLILADLAAHWRLFAVQASITLVEIVVGFVASMMFAIPLAVLLGASRTLEKMLYPLLVASQTVPVVSIAPILLAWFGFGLKPKIIVVVLITFFPVMMNAFAGMKSMSEQIGNLARSMGATRFQLFWHFQLPGALPHIFAGMKIATTLAVVGAIVAEFVGSDSGLGYEITVAGANLDLAHQFAAILVLSAMGLSLFALMSRIEKICLPWHISVRGARGGKEG